LIQKNTFTEINCKCFFFFGHKHKPGVGSGLSKKPGSGLKAAFGSGYKQELLKSERSETACDTILLNNKKLDLLLISNKD
jgi:hypothetical protein